MTPPPARRGKGGAESAAVPRFEVAPHSKTGKLILEPARPGYLLAQLETEGLKCRSEFLAGAGFDLGVYFQALESPDWTGECWLESPLGELYLNATRLGEDNLLFRVELEANEGIPWRVETAFELSEIALATIVERAGAFLSALHQAKRDGS